MVTWLAPRNSGNRGIWRPSILGNTNSRLGADALHLSERLHPPWPNILRSFHLHGIRPAHMLSRGTASLHDQGEPAY
jgi:hypothetical protein